MFLISPVAPEPSAGPATAAQAQPLPAAKALRLGILDNGKGNADHLLRFVADRLQQLFPVESLVWLRKTSMSHPAQQEIYDRLVSETDFVVSAIAD
ncbi:MAG TPA: hypothetical protein VHP37_32115 [Burkholderiales bacterium]|nr:hypothetical protein [Burkholderiales bacterium]